MTDASGEQVDLAQYVRHDAWLSQQPAHPRRMDRVGGRSCVRYGEREDRHGMDPGADLAAVCEALVGQGDVTIVPIPASGTLFLENTNVHHQRLVLRLIRLRSASPIP